MSQECDKATRAANRILDDSNSTAGSRSPVMLLSLLGPAKMEAHNLEQKGTWKSQHMWRVERPEDMMIGGCHLERTCLLDFER